ncbi:Gas1-like protein [Metarhizium acridum CQMa 102]|uniref:Gas1-like protein n=1 Tax=Metarhizium acridum (strain CQMa 102) TaxID=655827 RepID=E9DRE9_METAQ|nr:Gas1-like protein [Metarhizium acridum CQMa 102]EFY93827.1 Gas1-like protein [Metarhizium acridum CQMa 102]
MAYHLILRRLLALSVLYSLSSAHAVILGASCDGGKTSSIGMGTNPDVPRTGEDPNPFQLDSPIIRTKEKDNLLVNGCGRTKLQTNIDVANETEIAIQNNQIAGYGSGPFFADIDEKSNVGNFREIGKVDGIDGKNGIQRTAATAFDVAIPLPSDMKCEGGKDLNVCTLRIRNLADAGPFGGCVALQDLTGGRGSGGQGNNGQGNNGQGNNGQGNNGQGNNGQGNNGQGNNGQGNNGQGNNGQGNNGQGNNGQGNGGQGNGGQGNGGQGNGGQGNGGQGNGGQGNGGQGNGGQGNGGQGNGGQGNGGQGNGGPGNTTKMAATKREAIKRLATKMVAVKGVAAKGVAVKMVPSKTVTTRARLGVRRKQSRVIVVTCLAGSSS